MVNSLFTKPASSRASYQTVSGLFLAGFWLPQIAVAQVTFTDMTDRIPGHVYDGGWEHFVGGGVAVFDCDNNGLPDIFAAGGSYAAILLRNQGDFSFETMPLDDIPHVTGAYPLDIDGDAILDLYVMRVGPDIALKGGNDCTFSDATAQWQIPQTDQWTTAFTAWWAPGDDRPTLAIGHYVDRSNPNGPFEACDTNTLLHPVSDGYRSEILGPGYCALSMLAAQDARGVTTLRISNDRHYYVRGGSEQMYDINALRFLGPEDGWPSVSLWGMGIASRDLTGDGRDEVMLTSMGDQLMQLATPEGGYISAPYNIGTYAHRPHTGDDGRPSTGWHAQFGDINNDTRPDLFIAKGNVDQMPGNAMNDPNNLLIQKEDGTFVETAETAGVADTARTRGAALADFDGDGRLDLITINRRASARLYRNETPAENWLSVLLTQPTGNRYAIGAVVKIGDQSQQNTVGGGHASGIAGPLHFGLGSADQVEITVQWPDGTETQHIATANQQITLSKQ